MVILLQTQDKSFLIEGIIACSGQQLCRPVVIFFGRSKLAIVVEAVADAVVSICHGSRVLVGDLSDVLTEAAEGVVVGLLLEIAVAQIVVG